MQDENTLANLKVVCTYLRMARDEPELPSMSQHFINNALTILARVMSPQEFKPIDPDEYDNAPEPM
jgi:hypothetical protein